METVINLDEIPLKALSRETMSLLSALLNPEKVLLTKDKYPRDWRGLAALASVPGEYNASIRCCSDQVAKVLELWYLRKDGTAKIGMLQQYLCRLDRFDVYEDSETLLREDAVAYRMQRHLTNTGLNDNEDFLTYDDVMQGEIQKYHAYVLYAEEDWEFVESLLERMRARGFKLCTEQDLLIGFTTQYGPITRLISERCERLIIVYSPDFLKSPANVFYMDNALGASIETQERKILPCMYRQCELPASHKYFFMLHYQRPGMRPAYNLWDRLEKSLIHNSKMRRETANQLAQPVNGPNLAIPEPELTRSVSSLSLEHSRAQEPARVQSASLANVNQLGKSKKPINIFKKIFRGREKKKKKIAIAELA